MGRVFPIIRNEKTSTLPTWWGVWEKGKLLERTAGVAESSGRIQVSVKPKILRIDWEAMARMKFETQRKWQRCSRRGADRTQFSKIALLSACDVRASLRENKNVLETYYLLPDSTWEVRKNTLTYFFISEINYCILENNLLLYYWIKYQLSWCVVGVLAHYGCRHIIQVDAAHWWWLRRFPLPCKALWVPRKALYKCNKLIIN